MQPKVSRRASRVWDRLGQWYGSRLADNYGPTPPEDWCEVIDRTDDERLHSALSHLRHQSPVHPPTLGQLEDAIPKRETGLGGPSSPTRLAELLLKTHGSEMCAHQFRMGWNYFGPLTTFEVSVDKKKPDYVTHPDPRGVQCPPCEACEKPSYRVLLTQERTEGVAA
jgi:hypothetical protein